MFRIAMLLCLITGSTFAQSPASMTIDHLYSLESARDPVMMPDGKSTVYVRQWFDAGTKTERFSLWSSKSGALEKDEPDARSPTLSPDGKWIAFLSTRPLPRTWTPFPKAPLSSDAATDVWMIPTAGGQPIPLAPPGRVHGRVFNDGFYGRLAFSPDGKKIVFVADDGNKPLPIEHQNDVKIVRPDQGEGYTGYGTAQIWIATLTEKPDESVADRVEALTTGDVWWGDPQWMPDGKSIVAHANRTDDRESARYSINKNFDIFRIDIASKKITQLTDGPGPDVSPRISPDGKRIACLSVPRKGSHRDVFNVKIIDEAGVRVVFDHFANATSEPLKSAPSFPLPNDCWADDEHVTFIGEAGTESPMIRMNIDTGKTEVVEANRFSGMLPVANPKLKGVKLAYRSIVKWKNDGMELEGILTVPRDEVAKQSYPLIVWPHGGPHSRTTNTFDFTAQIFAANGYVVFQPNFRGSSGYGQKFVDADRGDFGEGDYRDIQTGIDELIRQHIADKDRLFMYGTSYGGFMTTWSIGHTERFKAAVAINAVTDLSMMWGLSDIQSWTEWEFGGRPWEVADKMRKFSPITYVDRVKTPTLVLHSRDDRRVPLPMGVAFHRALQSRGVPTEMVIYPDEGHGIRQPRHREDVLQRTLDWFAKHGKSTNN